MFSLPFRSIKAKQNKKEDDKYHKGIPRPYCEAKSLDVIDPCIAPLTNSMNCEPLISTTGSCQGHGLIFIAVPPYVSFKSSIEIASAIAKVLYDDCHASHSKLNYHWELNARFDSNSELTYILIAPGISSGKWFYATRRGLNKDFELLSLMVQKTLDHFKCKKIIMKSEPNQACASKAHQHQYRS